MAKWTGLWEVTPAVPFFNPNPIAYLVGWSNEAPIIVDEQEVTALMNSGAQDSSVSLGFCKWMTLKVHLLDRLLGLQGTGGSAIPYLGYVEVNLQIPGIRGYNEDVLLLVIPITPYSEKLLVMVGSKIIDSVMGMITKGELVRATTTWKKAHLPTVALERSRGWGCCKGGLSLHSPWPYCTQGILSGWHPGTHMYHMEGHHSCFWDHKY